MRRVSGRWASAMALTVLLAAFVAGGLVGGALVRMLDAGEPTPVADARPARPMLFSGEGPLSERLELTEEQRAAIEAILVENRQKAALLLREIQPRLRARYDSTMVAIDHVLTAEQQAEFRRMRLGEWDRIRRGGFGRGWVPAERELPPPATEGEPGR